MNKLFGLFAIALLSLSFVLAADDSLISLDNAVDLYIPVPGITISLNSPASGAVFEATDGAYLMQFSFDAKSDLSFTQIIDINGDVLSDISANDIDLSQSSALKCVVEFRSSDNTIYTLDAVLDSATNQGKAKSSFLIGDYKWKVSCTDGNIKSSTEERLFSIIPTVVIPPTGGSGNAETTTSSSSSNEEGSGRRRVAPTLVPLSNLAGSNLNTNNLENDASSNQPAGITGAVIGALGKKGALGMGIFITLVGVIALAVYNRTRLGFVKA